MEFNIGYKICSKDITSEVCAKEGQNPRKAVHTKLWMNMVLPQTEDAELIEYWL
jgi:hypothetical protein